MITDAELLRRYLYDRDDPAFAAIVRKHGPMVLATCRHTARHQADAEDAFQATFLVLASRAEVIRTPTRLGAWLHGVAVRCARKARDATRRSATNPPESFGSLPATSPHSLEPDLPAVIDDALASIPDAYRAAVVLCHLEGLTRAEAARELGWSEGTLSGRLHRALKLLGERLTARGVTATGAMVLAVLSARSASATVPLRLIASTCSTASLVSAGFGEPGSAHSLARGVLRAMTFRKLKLAALVLGVFGLGAFALLGRLDARPTDSPVRMRIKAPVPADKAIDERWKQVCEVKPGVEVMAIALHDEMLATVDDDDSPDKLKLWDAKTGKSLDLKIGGSWLRAPVKTFRFAAEGRYLVMASSAKGCIRFEQRFGQMLGSALAVVSVVEGFSDDLGVVLIRDFNRPKTRLGIHPSLDEGKPMIGVIECADDETIAHANVTPDGKRVVVTTDLALRIYGFDETGTKEEHKIELPAKTKLTAPPKLSNDGKRLAVVGEKGFAKVFDADTGKRLCELAGHDGTVAAVAFTPDGKQVVTACGKAVRVFDAKSGKKVSEFEAHTDDVTCLAITPDGKRLVTGSKDKTAKVWERAD